MTGQIRGYRNLLGVRHRQSVQGDPRLSAVQLSFIFLAALACLAVQLFFFFFLRVLYVLRGERFC
jgi:hypothetical protein